MSISRITTARRTAVLLASLVLLLLGAAGCGDSDPGVIGPGSIDAGLSPEGQREDYMDGVSGALQQLAVTQSAQFGKAVDTGNKKQLQMSALQWRQGLQQLKQLNPPKDAAAAHKALITAVQSLDAWNQRIVAAAPNKARTKSLARQAVASPASASFEKAVCDLVDAGYEVVDPGACTPLSNAAGPSS